MQINLLYLINLRRCLMKKEVFTFMTTLALISANSVLAMEDKEEKRTPIAISSMPTIEMLEEVDKHGSFLTTSGEEYEFVSGNPSKGTCALNLGKHLTNPRLKSEMGNSNGQLSYFLKIEGEKIKNEDGSDSDKYLGNMSIISMYNLIFLKVNKK